MLAPITTISTDLVLFVVSVVELFVLSENMSRCSCLQKDPIRNTEGNISVIINPKNENTIFGSDNVATIKINMQCKINPVDPTPAIANN